MDGFYNYFCEQTVINELNYSLNKILKKEPKKNKGLLIVFEGIDGAGKSTQVESLIDWLDDRGYDVFETKWNSSDVVEKATKAAKDKRELTPMLYCLLHAADMIHRYEQDILPALEQNKIVVSDRYIYTSIVRDEARGINTEVLDKVYEGLREPDVVFHCVVPIHIAFTRLIKEKSLSYYGTGSDLNLADSREENYVKYENILNRLYNKVLPRVSGYHKLNMNRSIEEISKEVQNTLAKKFGIGKYN